MNKLKMNDNRGCSWKGANLRRKSNRWRRTLPWEEFKWNRRKCWPGLESWISNRWMWKCKL